MFVQGNSRVNTEHVLTKGVKPNRWGSLGTVWAVHGMIGTRGRLRTFGCNPDRKLDQIGARACLHINSKIACTPLCLLKKNPAKRCRLKTKAARFGAVVNRGIVKYMGTNMLNDTLSRRAVERYRGLTLGACQTNVICNTGVSVGVENLHHKTSSLLKMLLHWCSNSCSVKTYHAFLNRENSL